MCEWERDSLVCDARNRQGVMDGGGEGRVGEGLLIRACLCPSAAQASSSKDFSPLCP